MLASYTIQYDDVVTLKNSNSSPFVEIYQFQQDGKETTQKKAKRNMSLKKWHTFGVYKVYPS